MSNEQLYRQCQDRAAIIVAAYRSQCPDQFDPKAWYASTTFLVIAILATAAAATGTVMSAQAQSDAAKYNAAVAKNQAETAAQQAAFDAQQIRDKNRRILGAQRAAFAASGVDPDAGTPVDIRADSANQGELEALTAIYTGRSGANSALARAKLENFTARSAMTSGYIQAGSSLLSGASSAYQINAGSKNPTF